MQNGIRMSLIAGVALSLLACGSGAKIGGGKEGAASALFAASGPTKTSGALLDLVGQNLDFGASITVDCKFGGKATLKGFMVLPVLTGGTGFEQSFTVAYDNCAATTYDNPKSDPVEADKVLVNGQMVVSQKVAFDVKQANATGSVSQSIKADIRYGGAFDDFIKSDVTQTVEWSKLGTVGGTLNVTLAGSITTSSETHSYSSEQITLTAGAMIAAEK